MESLTLIRASFSRRGNKNLQLTLASPSSLTQGPLVFVSSNYVFCHELLIYRALLDRVLYTPERLGKIAVEATRENSVFSLNDRVGLVQDAMALSKAGLLKLSGVLTLVDVLKHEKESTFHARIFSSKCSHAP